MKSFVWSVVYQVIYHQLHYCTLYKAARTRVFLMSTMCSTTGDHYCTLYYCIKLQEPGCSWCLLCVLPPWQLPLLYTVLLYKAAGTRLFLMSTICALPPVTITVQAVNTVLLYKAAGTRAFLMSLFVSIRLSIAELHHTIRLCIAELDHTIRLCIAELDHTIKLCIAELDHNSMQYTPVLHPIFIQNLL